MGQTRVTVEVRPVSGGKRAWEGLFLVDTGATDCLVPSSALKKLRVPVEGSIECELADGTIKEYDFGFIRVKFLGQETVCQAIFGPNEAEPLLGVVALENTGITVDPRSNSLKKWRPQSLKHRRVRRRALS